MNNPPPVPRLISSGNNDRDIEDNLLSIFYYLNDLFSWLSEGEPSSGWSTTGVVEDKDLVVGDTLADTQHFLGSLVVVLRDKNILGS